MSLIPAFIRRRIAHRPNLVKIIDNIGWLFFDKILRMGVGLVVSVWIARYLGPEQFGKFNYATAFVAMFGAIATLGLNGIVVRDLVRMPKNTHAILGTAFALQVTGALVAIGLIVCIIGQLRPEDELTKAMVVIIGFSLVFQSSAVVKYWFESVVQSRYVVWVENGMFIVVAAGKIALIYYQAPLIAFAWAVLVEATLVAIGLFAIYIMQTKALYLWQVSRDRALRLLRDSWPLILSGIAIMIYMRIDQIMLGNMIGNEAVGIYSAALRISEVWYMIPMGIAASFFPAIIESKNRSEALYKQRMQNLLNMMATSAIVIALIVSFIANDLIALLFGDHYVSATPVLVIHIWSSLFVFIGVVGNKWYLAENLQGLSFYRTAIGALINVALNLILIPSSGAVGAAVATVISYGFAAYILDATSFKTMPLFKAKTKAIFMGPYLLLRAMK